MKKINLTESQLHNIIRKCINENAMNDYNREISKNIAYLKNEAIQNIETIIENFSKIEGYDAYKQSNISSARIALKDLQRIHSVSFD